MERFNFHNYEYISDNKILKIKLADSQDWIFVSRVSRSVLQSFQPALTPITKINLQVVKSIELYKQNREEYNNQYELRVEPEEVKNFELIEI